MCRERPRTVRAGPGHCSVREFFYVPVGNQIGIEFAHGLAGLHIQIDVVAAFHGAFAGHLALEGGSGGKDLLQQFDGALAGEQIVVEKEIEANPEGTKVGNCVIEIMNWAKLIETNKLRYNYFKALKHVSPFKLFIYYFTRMTMGKTIKRRWERP